MSVIGKFKLIAGRHVTWAPGSKPLTPEEVAQGKKREEKHYSVGDVIESAIDLVDRYGSSKFERVRFFDSERAAHAQTSSGGTATVEGSMRQVWKFEELNSMSVNELKALALEEKIDLKNAKSKEDIIKVILS